MKEKAAACQLCALQPRSFAPSRLEEVKFLLQETSQAEGGVGGGADQLARLCAFLESNVASMNPRFLL